MGHSRKNTTPYDGELFCYLKLETLNQVCAKSKCVKIKHKHIHIRHELKSPSRWV